MKSIYARLGDLKLGETLDDGTTLGQVSATLQQIGVDVLNDSGEMRNMGDIIEDLMGKWRGLTTAQQQATAVKLAGVYQYNNLTALLENSEMYYEQLQASEDSLGSVNEQQEIYMDSLTAIMNQLKASFEGFINSIFNVDDIKPFIDQISGLIQMVTSFTNAVGSDALGVGIAGLAGNIFSSSMAKGLNNAYRNRMVQQNIKNSSNSAQTLLAAMGVNDTTGLTKNSTTYNYANQLAKHTSSMTEEELEGYKKRVQEIASIEQKRITLESQVNKEITKQNTLLQLAGDAGDDLITIDNGRISGLSRITNEIAGQKESLQESLKVLDSAQEEIMKISISAERMQGKLSSGNEYTEIQNSINSSVGNLKRMMQYLESTIGGTALYEQIQQAYSQIDTKGIVSNGVLDVEKYIKLTDSVDNFTAALKNALSINRELLDGVGLTGEQLQKLVDDMTSAVNADESMKQLLPDELKSKAREKLIDDLISIASSAAQVYSSFRAIQNLGEIWSNDEISGGEKIAQTLESILYIIPMLVSGFVELRRAARDASTAMSAQSSISLFQNLSASLGSYSKNMKAAGNTSKVAGLQIKTANVALKALNGASSLASKGVSALSKVLGALGGPVGIVLTVIGTVVSAVSSAMSKAEEEAKQKLEEIVEAGTNSATKLQEVSDAKEAYEDLYQQFKDTGVVTDELKSAIKSYADALGISIDTDNLKADAVERINSQLERQLELLSETEVANIRSAQNVLTNESSENGGIFNSSGNRLGYLDQYSAYVDDPTSGINNPMNETAYRAYQNIFGGYSSISPSGFVAGTDAVDRYNELQDAIETATSLYEHQKTVVEGLADAIEQQPTNTALLDSYNSATSLLAVYEDVVDKLPSWIQDDRWQSYVDNQKQLAENELSGFDFSSYGDDWEQALLDVLSDKNSDIAYYLRAVGSENGSIWLQGMLQGIADEASANDIEGVLVNAGFGDMSAYDVAKYVGSRLGGGASSTSESIARQQRLRGYFADAGYGSNYDIYAALASLEQTYNLDGEDIDKFVNQAVSMGLDAGDAISLLCDSVTAQAKLAVDDYEGVVDVIEEEKARLESNQKESNRVTELMSAMLDNAVINGESNPDIEEYTTQAQQAKTGFDTYASRYGLNDAQYEQAWNQYVLDPSQDYANIIKAVSLNLGDLATSSKTAAETLGDFYTSVEQDFISRTGSSEDAGWYANSIMSYLATMTGGDVSKTMDYLSQINSLMSSNPDLSYQAFNGLLGTAIERGIDFDVLVSGIESGLLDATKDFGYHDDTYIANAQRFTDSTRAFARSQGELASEDVGSYYATLQTTAQELGLTDAQFNDFISSIEGTTATLDDMTAALNEYTYGLTEEGQKLRSTEDYIAQGQSKYLERSSGFADKDTLDSNVSSLIEYGQSVGLSYELMTSGAVNFNQSVSDVQNDMRALALGLENATDASISFYDAMVDAGFAADAAQRYSNMFSGLSEEGQSTLQSNGWLDNPSDLASLLNFTNGDENLAVELSGMIDPDSVNEQIKELSKPGALEEFLFYGRIENATDIVSQAIEEAQNGDVSEDTVKALIDMDGAWKDVNVNSAEGLMQLVEYRDMLNEIARTNALGEIADQAEEVQDAFDDIDFSALEDSGLQEFGDELEDFFDKQYELDIQTNADVSDTLDGLLAVEQEIDNAAANISDDYQVSAENMMSLIDTFGVGILANAKAVSDEMIQLDQASVDAAIANAETEQAAQVNKYAADLEAMAVTYDQKSQIYAIAAQQYSAAAQQEVEADDSSAQTKSEIDANLTTALASLDQSKAESAASAAQSEQQNFVDVANSSNENMSITASNAASAAQSMAMSFAQGAASAVMSIAQIATAINQAGQGEIPSFSTYTLTSGSTYSGQSGVNSGTSNTYKSPDISSDYNGPSLGDMSSAEAAEWAAQQSEKYAQMAAGARAAAEMVRSLILGSAAPSARPSSGSGGGSGGSGGGSGSGDSYDPKIKEYQEDEIDRYEKVDTLLDAITADFEKLNDEQERLIGYDLADNITEQIYLLRQQIDLQKEKLGIQKEEAEEYRKQLENDYGVTFNDEGFITNYAERYRRVLDTLNSLISQYNATTTEEGQEALETQIDAAQEAYDTFVNLVDKYDEMISQTIKDTEKEIQDLYDQIEDLNIEMFQKSVEATDNIKELNEALVDFNAAFSGLQSDDPFRAMATSAEKLAGYFDVASDAANEYYDTLIGRYKELMGREGVSSSQKTFYQSQIDAINDARKQIGQGSMENFGTGYLDLSMMSVAAISEQIRQFEETGMSSIFGEDSADLYDTAKTVFDQATGLISDYESEVDNLRDSILDAIDDIAERMDERKEQYEAIVDALEHQASIIEMIHGDEAYDKLNQVLAAQQQNYRQQIAESQQQIEYWEDLISYMEEGSDEYKAIQEQISETQSNLNDLIETSLENLQQQYTNIVNKITDQWAANAMGDDLDWIAQEWELINRNADYYLDEVNAAYNIQKLQGQYLELLDGATSLDVQQKITEQMNQQLQYLREKDKLSEYDVAYAQAQLEILQKQIALQEAQANKSQMKLRRDSQGNYSYVYTANEGDVAGAQSDLLDAQNNAYNLSKEQIKQTQDDSISALQQAQELINNIWTNANLTLEEKKERTQKIIDSLKEYLAGTSEQLSTAEKNIINDFIGMTEILTDENKTKLDDVYQQIIDGNVDAFDQIDTRWNTSITTWLQNMESFNQSTDDMFSELVSETGEYQDQIDDIADLVGQDFNDMAGYIQDCVDKTNDLAESNANFINQLKEDSGVIKDYESRLQEYASKIADAENAMRSYQQQVNDLQSQLVAKEQENSNLTGQIQDLYDQINAGKNNGSNGSGSGGSGSGSGNGSGYSDSDLALGIAQNIWTYGTAGGWGNDPTRSSKLTNAYGMDFARTVQSIINDRVYSGHDNELVNYDSKKFSSYSLLGYDTGGYTGEWSDPSGSGRLALLHTKELVLNQEDTDNILQAVQAVRAMTTELKNESFSKMIDYLSKQGSKALIGDMNPGTVEQDVHITATFPNATSADDIREAILGLNDQVMQYAHRQ